MFDKLNMQSKEITQRQIEQLAILFPHVVTEVSDGQGGVKKAVDFTLLKQELTEVLVEGEKERYQLTWPGKRQAILTANERINKTLRPVKEDSVDWENTKNIYIEGDNLDALKLLQASYMGKVKCIYIDPPYNTGNDFVYNDSFKQGAEEYLVESGQKDELGNRFVVNSESNGRYHSDWLTMMYSRLKLARNLLRDDGVIFISIDDNEFNNLSKVISEIFGELNFLANISWQNLDTIKNDAKYFSVNNEYILCYAKNIEKTKIVGLKKTEKQNAYYKNYDNDPRGNYLLTPLHAKSGSDNSIYQYTFNNGQNWRPPQGTYPRYSLETLKKLESAGRLYLDPKGVKIPQKKTYLSEVSDRMPPTTFWGYSEFGSTRNSNKEISELIEKGIFQNSKPVKLMKFLIDIIDSKESICLDFFSGSATTAHAVMQLNAEDGGNRQYIMVQLPEESADNSEARKSGYKNICEIGKERIRRAAKKIKEETNADIDYGFRVFRVDSSNMKDVYYTPKELVARDLLDLASNIKEGRSGEDLLIQVLLEWGIELSLPMEALQIDGVSVHAVAGHLLVACFEENISESVITKIAEMQPERALFRDASFANDAAKLNVTELFKRISRHTEIKVL